MRSSQNYFKNGQWKKGMKGRAFIIWCKQKILYCNLDHFVMCDFIPLCCKVLTHHHAWRFKWYLRVLHQSLSNLWVFPAVCTDVDRARKVQVCKVLNHPWKVKIVASYINFPWFLSPFFDIAVRLSWSMCNCAYSSYYKLESKAIDIQPCSTRPDRKLKPRPPCKESAITVRLTMFDEILQFL